ncbi:MAG: PAS domain-containing sensor histidine kinase [Ignavibacteriaceae bacterium]
MKTVIKKSDKTEKKNIMKKSESKTKVPAAQQFEDIQKLVYLLQVHQVELEHQNEELRIAHEELEESRNKYVNLFDFSPTPYFTLDKGGIIKEVNLSASKMFSVDRNKLIGKCFTIFISLEQRDIFNSFINNVLNSDVKHSCELKIINKDKRIFQVLLEGLKLDDTLGLDQKCQVALIDLTEYKKIENSLKESNEQLTELNATKDKFFSIIAHDLRSPFQSLLSFSELLVTEIETLSHEEIVSFSGILNNNLRSLYGLLVNLLHWLFLQRNLLECNPVNINLYDEVNKIMGISKQSAKEKNIDISNNINIGTLVFADIDMLRLVIQNLILNAIKFTQTNGRIIVSSIRKGGNVEVSVEDNGIGIDKENISKLFQFNTIFTTEGTLGEKGTGLGLPLCKEFVERNSGKIWAESELGKGSKFIFTLRVAT